MKPHVSLGTKNQLQNPFPTSDYRQIENLTHKGIKKQILSVQWLASQLQISERHLLRIIKKRTGKTTNEYLNDIKLNLANDLLLSDRRVSVKSISSYLLFNDSKYFSRLFKKKFGYNPSQTKNSYQPTQNVA